MQDPFPVARLEHPVQCTITPPGSKSITCRAMVLAALANGESRLVRPLRSDDTDGLLEALVTLGAQAQWEGEDVVIEGVAGEFPRGGRIDLGDGGTPTRFMIACACLAAQPVVVDGSARMRERPIAEGVAMLRELGARIDFIETEGRLPVRVQPSETFLGGSITVGETASSQFISALMLIGSCLPAGLKLQFEGPLTSASYVELTRQCLAAWDVQVISLDPPPGPFPGREGEKKEQLRRVALEPGVVGECEMVVPQPKLRGRVFAIEPDASSAVYWALASAIVPGCAIETPLPLESKQPDAAALRLMTQMQGRLEGFSFDAGECPDGAVALAVLASRCRGVSLLSGLKTLRVKESDRIAALATELARIGCTVESGPDWLRIDPSTQHERPVTIETYNDHRIAMAFAVLGLARGGVSIRNPECVAKSYPGFWRDFERLAE